ncbi:MAG: NUDIX hydrolase [Patescibacteria group bacterium]
MKRTNSAGGIVISSLGKILVVTNEIGSITFPKGSQKAGEQPIDTARREITEESGLTEFEIHKELGVLIRPGYTAENSHTPSVTKHIHMFLCTTRQEKLSPVADDVLSAEWVNLSEVPDILSRKEETEFFVLHLKEIELLI